MISQLMVFYLTVYYTISDSLLLFGILEILLLQLNWFLQHTFAHFFSYLHLLRLIFSMLCYMAYALATVDTSLYVVPFKFISSCPVSLAVNSYIGVEVVKPIILDRCYPRGHSPKLSIYNGFRYSLFVLPGNFRKIFIFSQVLLKHGDSFLR